MKRLERQAGFSIVSVLAVIAVAGILGASGWFVYQHNRTKLIGAAPNSDQAAPAQNQQTATSPSTNQKTIQLPELGIQISVPASLSDLVYHTTTVTLPNGEQNILAYFSTKALTAADAKCSTDAAPLGTLGRVNGQYPTQSEDPTNVLDYGQLIKQFPTFYISAGYPQAGCSAATSAGSDFAAASNNSLANTDKSAFQASFSTIQPLN